MPAIVDRRSFLKGVVLLLLFVFVLVPLFVPVFNGQTGMQAADDLFNSLSKGSSYYIPAVAEEVDQFQGTEVGVKIKTKDATQTDIVSKLFAGAGAEVIPEADGVQVRGDLGAVLEAAVVDADELFNQQEAAILSRYGVEDARAVLYYWHDALGQIEKALVHEGMFKESLFVKRVLKRAVEPAYNFAGITAAKVSERAGITVFLLTFYVFYTIWYGFGIMYLFEGLGITASAKH
jgi:hypothetical protein